MFARLRNRVLGVHGQGNKKRVGHGQDSDERHRMIDQRR